MLVVWAPLFSYFLGLTGIALAVLLTVASKLDLRGVEAVRKAACIVASLVGFGLLVAGVDCLFVRRGPISEYIAEQLVRHRRHAAALVPQPFAAITARLHLRPAMQAFLGVSSCGRANVKLQICPSNGSESEQQADSTRGKHRGRWIRCGAGRRCASFRRRRACT